MATRGLVVFKRKGQYSYYYNHFDSYPSGLGEKLVSLLKKGIVEEIPDELDLEWVGSSKLFPDPDIVDFLFHEYVYLIDLEKRTFRVYKSVFRYSVIEIMELKGNVPNEGFLQAISRAEPFDNAKEAVKIADLLY